MKRILQATGVLAGLAAVVWLVAEQASQPAKIADRETAAIEAPVFAAAKGAETAIGHVPDDPAPPAVAKPGAGGEKLDPLTELYACADWPCPLAPGMRADPRAAGSAEEARWMATRGFPTRAQREWADSTTAEAILARAQAERSLPLRMLGLERSAHDATDPRPAMSAAQELDELAGKGRQHYAMYAGMEVHLRVAALLPANDSRRGYHLGAAASLLKRAVLLGDSSATALYALFPQDVAANLSFWIRAEDNAIARLQRGDIAPQAAGFGFRDVAPRPIRGLRNTYLRDLAIVGGG